MIGYDDGPQVLDGLSLARDADQILFAEALDIPRADIGVVGVQRLDNLGHGHAVGGETVGVWSDVILPFEPTDGVDLGHTRRVAKLGPDHPVLKRAQILGGVGFAVRTSRALLGHHRIHEDFAQPGGDGAEFGGHAFGKLPPRGLKPFVDQLAREIDVGAIGEDDCDLAEPVAGDRAGVFKARHARDGRLDRKGDPLFGLQG